MARALFWVLVPVPKMLFALGWQIFGRDVGQVGACRRLGHIDSGRGAVTTGPNHGAGTRERGPEAEQPPDLLVIALQTGRPKSRKLPFRYSRRSIFRGVETIMRASASARQVMREEICSRKPRACPN